jgi:predicted ATPase/DNA-binding CsgD family transcriptional regulator
VSPLRHNLPAPLTSFVGRERELAEVKRLLAGTRLLTLVGAGGCGKTRLALQAAREVLEEYADGVWLVDLASLSDPDLVPQAVASALSVSEQPGRSVTESLVRYLRPKVVLLLVDNCEHLVSGCAILADALLRGCPALRILATGQEGLRIGGELAYPVPSLSVPDPDDRPSVNRVMQYEAVRLFAERASFHQPGFSVTDENAAGVAQVCHRLDGMPLAIELAAARVKALTVEQIASRLDDRFRLLTGGSRVALPRHQTLRAAMDWSYDLLSEQERALWRRVSVFAGGCTVEAAESICPGDGMEAADVLDLLMRLVDKSLVLMDAQAGEARYRLLETVRQYGRDRLWDSGESVNVQDRHLDWYLGLAERAEAELRGPGQEVWLERLETERDNLRLALEWSRTRGGGAEAEVRLAGALRWFWFIRGHWSEGRAWLEGALTRRSEAPSPEMARALLGAAMLARFQGHYQQARVLCEDGLAMSRDLGDKENLAWFLIWLGAVELHEGNYAKASALFEESLIPSRDLGDKWLISTALEDLGVVARIQGDLERAESLLGESLALSREVGDTWSVALALHSLGKVAFRRSDYSEAARFYTESLALSKQVRDRWIADDCLEGLAAVACAEGQRGRASRLLGASDALRETLGYRPLAAEQADHDRCVAAVRAGLGETAFAAAWAEGRTMTLEQAIDDALAAEAPAAIGAKAAATPSAKTNAGPLTPREREVAVLIAGGKTNREIAALLVITERTADTHVQHILNKLGFNSRAQIAAWAVEHGLHTLSPH